MEIENEPSLIKMELEKFAEELNTAGDCVIEFGANMPLQGLLSFESLTDHEEEMIAALTAHFGIDLSNPQVAKEYIISGTSGTSGEGETKVRVIATNNPQIFLGEYTYADKDIVWTIRPLEVEE